MHEGVGAGGGTRSGARSFTCPAAASASVSPKLRAAVFTALLTHVLVYKNSAAVFTSYHACCYARELSCMLIYPRDNTHAAIFKS